MLILGLLVVVLLCAALWRQEGRRPVLLGLLDRCRRHRRPDALAPHATVSDTKVPGPPFAALATVVVTAAPPLPAMDGLSHHAPLFLLVGDSTTAVQAVDGGGWGTGFLDLLTRGADGVNYGRNGATTRDYLGSGLWQEVLERIRAAAPTRPVHVTIQFGHNDQNPSRGVSLDDYRRFLVCMACDVLAAGATPILLTPLVRRDFDANGHIIDNLHDHRLAMLDAFHEVQSSPAAATTTAAPTARCCDLNAASLAYVAAIGHDQAMQYNLHGPDSGDTTHLNAHGSTVFGRLVADLLLGHPPALIPAGQRDDWAPGQPGNDDGGLGAWIRPTPLESALIWHGKMA